MQDADYRRIPVNTREGVVHIVVDDDDYSRFANFRWYLRGGYARRRSPTGAAPIDMHREILGLVPGDGLECDHINRDKLDNRRANLRIVTRAQNTRNVAGNAGSTSRHRGVYWSKRERRWVARGQFEGKTYQLGYHRTEDAAGVAVNRFWLSLGYEAPNLF